MFPLQDLNPRRRFPIVTYSLIGINVLVFLWQMTLSPRDLQLLFFDIAVVPRLITADPFSTESLLDTIRSMFLHGGFNHIIGNMLYLFLFGDNVEDRFGMIFYLVLYFASGFAAVFAQVVIDPLSQIPMIGASGAIAGVLGSYLVLYPAVRVRGLVFLGFFATIAELPAMIVLGFWFVQQLFNGIASLGINYQAGGVAFFAHIGGFVAGVIITFIFMMLIPQPPRPEREAMLYERARRPRF